MHIILLILKIIGKILLGLILFVLLLLLLLLLSPLGYEVTGEYHKDASPKGRASIHYLFHLLRIQAVYNEKGLKLRVKLLFFTVLRRQMDIGKKEEDFGENFAEESGEPAGMALDEEFDDVDYSDYDSSLEEDSSDTYDTVNADDPAKDKVVSQEILKEELVEESAEESVEESAEESAAEYEDGIAQEEEKPDYADGIGDSADSNQNPEKGSAGPASSAGAPSGENDADIPVQNSSVVVTQDFTENGEPSSEETGGSSPEDGNDDSEEPGKLQKLWDKICYYKEILEQPSMQKLFRRLKKRLFKILKHLLPSSLDVDAIIGLDDPAKMGKIMEAYAFLFAFYGDHLRFGADFDKERIDVRGRLKGYLVLGYILWQLLAIAVAALLQKDCRKFIFGHIFHKKDETPDMDL